MQRARGRPTWESLRLQHATAKRNLVNAIKISKRRAWKELNEQVDDDPWGRAFKIVTARLKSVSLSPPTCPVVLGRIVSTLFPVQHDRITLSHDCSSDVVPITTEELLKVSNKLCDAKAPGSDGIPNAALKTAVVLRPDLFLEVFNRCLREGVFPDQ